ncbi:MAG: hypothetical protein ABIL67_08385 [candidate division WOR-3 bacterium]
MWILGLPLKTLRNFSPFCALWVINCIYTFGVNLPKGYNRVYFPIPENKTNYPLVQDLSLNYGLNFVRSDGRLKPTDSTNAKLMIKTVFNTYVKTPEQYDNSGKVISYRLSLMGKIEFIDLSNGEKFVSDANITGNSLWFPDRESEDEALKRAIEDFYRQGIRHLFSQVEW